MHNTKTIQLNIKNYAKKGEASSFFTSDLYLLILGLAAALAWSYNKPLYTYIFFALIIILITFTQKTLTGTIPIILLSTFVFPDQQALLSQQTIFSIVGLFLVFGLCAIFHIIKYKRKFKYPMSTIGFIALFISAFFAGITTPNHFGSAQWLLGVGTMGGLLISIFILSIAIGEYNPLFTAKCFVTLALLMIVQIFVYLLKQDNILSSISYKTMYLGWGIGNTAAQILAQSMPFVLYAMCKSKHFSMLFLLVFILSGVAIITTLSRAVMLSTALFAIPMIVYSLRLSVKPLLSTIYFIALSAGVFLLIFNLYNDEFKFVLNKLLSTGFSDHGRIRLWKLAIEVFKSHNKFFGAGYVYGSALTLEGDYFITWYHNLFLEILANMGLLGITAFLIHLIQKLYYTLKRHTKFALSAFWSLCIMALFGLLDITYFQPSFLIPMLIIYLVTQNGAKLKTPIPQDELLV
ncbi:MAG: O-antigen ligase family protein [Christensenellaceae bacterium]|jgi:hypothetical protein|nr:O-antigen ligase family protein [Christensenellaceae bacterium]